MPFHMDNSPTRVWPSAKLGTTAREIRMAHALTVQAHDFPGGAGRPESAQDPVVPTKLKGMLHVAPHLAPLRSSPQ